MQKLMQRLLQHLKISVQKICFLGLGFGDWGKSYIGLPGLPQRGDKPFKSLIPPPNKHCAHFLYSYRKSLYSTQVAEKRAPPVFFRHFGSPGVGSFCITASFSLQNRRLLHRSQPSQLTETFIANLECPWPVVTKTSKI